ncbi:MAG: amino acid permease [Chloroflexi bacterium]|nr:amino acid permease [Chloroflexota bacterium]
MASSGERALKRRVGLVGAALSGVGVIVGAGIYALIGEAATLAGGAVWAAFLIAATVAGLTAVSYARMGRRVPKDSPEFNYVRVGMGLRWGFAAGWLMVWADVVSAAAVGLGFAGYFQSLTGAAQVPSALGLAAALALLAWVGIRESVLVVAFLTLLELAGLVLVVAVGIPHWGEQPLLEAPLGAGGIWTAGTLVFFAYLGFDELGNLAEEMRDPQRDLPRAIGLAVALSTALYLLVAVSVVSLVGWQVLAASSAPLADAVEGVLGIRGRTALALLALASTTNTVLLLMISASRSLYGMAQGGVLPAALAWIGRRHTPWASILLVWLFTSLFLFLGDIGLVAQITNLATLAAFSAVNISLFLLLRRERGRPSTKRWLEMAQPALALAATVWLAVRTGWLAAGLGLAVVLLGLALERWMASRRKGAQAQPPGANVGGSGHPGAS